MHKILNRIFPESEITKEDSNLSMSIFTIKPYGVMKKFPLKDSFIVHDKFRHPVFQSFFNHVKSNIQELNDNVIYKQYIRNKKTITEKKKDKKPNYRMDLDYKEKKIILSFQHQILISMSHYEGTTLLTVNIHRELDYNFNILNDFVDFENTLQSSALYAFLEDTYETIIIQTFGSVDNFFNENFHQNLLILEMLI